MFLDLSAAFDTIDHHILLKTLKEKYLITGTVLKWFESYLKDRKFFVKINDSVSNGRMLISGVPQRSVLGPILFSLYIQGLHEIITSHGLQYHIYADDIQLYCKYSKDNSQLLTVKKCLEDIKVWAQNNYLKLNEAKTKFLNISTKNSRFQQSTMDNSDDLVFVNEAKSLGVTIDNSINFKHQIKKGIWTRFWYFKQFMKNLLKIIKH